MPWGSSIYEAYATSAARVRGEFTLAVITAAVVVLVGVEEGILLAMALSLLRHVRHSYRPHTMVLVPDPTGRWMPAPAVPGCETEPGLIVYRFGADLFYANEYRFADEVQALVERAPTAVQWFVVDAGAITDLDYTAARSVLGLLEQLKGRGVNLIFARVSRYLRSDMDRHGITAAVGEVRIFSTLHEAVATVRDDAMRAKFTSPTGPHSAEMFFILITVTDLPS